MKNLIKGLLFLALFGCFQNANAQFLKKLAKKAEKAAERAITRKTEEKVERETSDAMDEVLGNKKKAKKKKNTSKKSKKSKTREEEVNNSDNNANSSSGNKEETKKELEVYSKFDFVPGDKQLFFDDFSREFVGDFPSKWNTNGTGELVTLNGSEKWLELKSGSTYIPDVTLPEEYTIEFDVLTKGIDDKTSSTSYLKTKLSGNNQFSRSGDRASISIPFVQYIARGVSVSSHVKGKRILYNTVSADIRSEVLEKMHISIAVNKKRVRYWINEKKYIDLPRMLAEKSPTDYLKFDIKGLVDGKDRVFIGNIKVAEGGVDLRRQLIESGKFSTNGILFASGSDKIEPQSYGIIRQISQALQQEQSMKLNIIGHTDADGADDVNMKLSKKRADAVKKALVTTYNIDASRLQTEGKGESAPIGDNKTTAGKAKNRRVEFIKIN